MFGYLYPLVNLSPEMIFPISFAAGCGTAVWGKEYQDQTAACENQERTGRFEANGMRIPEFYVWIQVFMNSIII